MLEIAGRSIYPLNKLIYSNALISDTEFRESVDFPHEWHVFLKMYCAKKGISLRQYIIDTVLNSIQGEVNEVDDRVFQTAADKLLQDIVALRKVLFDFNENCSGSS